LVAVFTSALAAISARTTSLRRFAAANISAVCPRVGSVASTSTPCAIKALTAPTCPDALASISAVTPAAVVPFTSAPAATSASIAAACPPWLASSSGV
jgi:hypothetical protein